MTKVSTVFWSIIYYAMYVVVVYDFFLPENPYKSYIGNYLFIMQALMWILILAVFLVSGAMLVASRHPQICSKMDIKEFKKAIDSHNTLWRKLKSYLIYYPFIIFVGVFVGDFSLFIVLLLCSFFAKILIWSAKQLVEGVEEYRKQENHI